MTGDAGINQRGSDVTHDVVSHDEWLAARMALLEEEKEFTRQRDRLNARRVALPWERVETDYVFTGPGGQVSMADLFAGQHQLLVYHFMFPPE